MQVLDTSLQIPKTSRSSSNFCLAGCKNHSSFRVHCMVKTIQLCAPGGFGFIFSVDSFLLTEARAGWALLQQCFKAAVCVLPTGSASLGGSSRGRCRCCLLWHRDPSSSEGFGGEDGWCICSPPTKGGVEVKREWDSFSLELDEKQC